MEVELWERETLINFNEGEAIAFVFTYSRSWQRHLEEKLGLKPVRDNGHGGREYELPKRCIRLPQAPRKLSPEAQERARLRGKALARRKSPANQSADWPAGRERAGVVRSVSRTPDPAKNTVVDGVLA